MDAAVMPSFLNRRVAFMSLGALAICLIVVAFVTPVLATQFSHDGAIVNPVRLRAMYSVAVIFGLLGLVAGYFSYLGLSTDALNWPRHFGRSVITLVILFFLGLQTVAIAMKVGAAPLWPFMDYPMFSGTRYEGDRIEIEPRVFATLDDGSEVQLTHMDFGLITWTFHGFIGHLLSGDSETYDRRFDFDHLVRLYNDSHERKLSRIRIETSPWILTKNGGQQAPPEVLSEIDVAPE